MPNKVPICGVKPEKAGKSIVCKTCDLRSACPKATNTGGADVRLNELLTPPFSGMKEKPYGLPGMFEPWMGCVMWAIGKEEFREQFLKGTGHDLSKMANTSPINTMIDGATGYTEVVMAAWCDWVTVNLWG
jgi:hypothetical protein